MIKYLGTFSGDIAEILSEYITFASLLPSKVLSDHQL